jgi:hypothetical protein
LTVILVWFEIFDFYRMSGADTVEVAGRTRSGFYRLLGRGMGVFLCVPKYGFLDGGASFDGLGQA